MLCEFLYADNLIQLSWTIARLRNKFIKWKETFECNGLEVSLGKAKVMVNSGITQDGLSKSKVDQCFLRRLRVKANSVLCVHCGVSTVGVLVWKG